MRGHELRQEGGEENDRFRIEQGDDKPIAKDGPHWSTLLTRATQCLINRRSHSLINARAQRFDPEINQIRRTRIFKD